MSRSHGKLKAEVWGDDDWCGLSMGAQWCYSMLLSQGKLSLAGALDLMPKRWASYSADMDADTLLELLDELVAAGKIVIDDRTDELVIRSFARHDINPGQFNTNLVKGFWSAWRAITSPMLRRVVVVNLPDHIWEKSGDLVPEEATKLRFEPGGDSGQNQAFEPDVRTGQSDQATELPIPLPKPLPILETGAAEIATAVQSDGSQHTPTLNDLLRRAMGIRARKCADDIDPCVTAWLLEHGEPKIRAVLEEFIESGQHPPQWPRQFEPMLRARPNAAPVKPRDCTEMGNTEDQQADCGSGLGLDGFGCPHCERGSIIAKQRVDPLREAS